VSIESDTRTPPTPGALPLPLGQSRLGHPAESQNDLGVRAGFYLNQCIRLQGPSPNCDPGVSGYDNRERIDGISGDSIQTGSPTVLPLPAGTDSPLSLIVRYFSASDVTASSEIWLWKDRVTSGAAAELTVAVWDEEENSHSITFRLPNEVNFAETEDIISPGARGGWLRLKFTCGAFGHCGYNPVAPATWGTTTSPTTPIQAVAYGLQFANSQDETLRWDAAFPAHRQYTNYIGGPSQE
jgi:hypothetical protein